MSPGGKGAGDSGVAVERAAERYRRLGPAGDRRAGAPKRRPRIGLGAMPALATVAALGLILVALGDTGAREGDVALKGLFWAGLVLIYAPISYRLIAASPQRSERLALVLTLALSLFLVKVLRSPLEFVRFDELGWWRATNEVVVTGHIFHSNPLNVATSSFPTLATITAAVAQLTGLSIFHAGLLVIGTARAVLILALFLFLERLTGSSRAAGIGILVYACNPSFLYFDAQFGYESLALMLAAALLLASQRWSNMRRFDLSPPVLGVAAVLAVLTCGLAVTHHMTSFALLAFLGLWTGATALSRRLTGSSTVTQPLKGPGFPAAMMLIAVALWFVLVSGSATISELGGVFSRAFESVFDLITGSGSSKQLFSGAGQSEHLIARALAVASVVPVLALIALGLLTVWRNRIRRPLWWALSALGVLYPVTLGLRLTLASSETSQRASEFVFVGIAFFAAILVMGLRWPRWSGPNTIAVKSGLTAAALICFIGGFIVGELQATRQPGPYLVGAEDRSVTPQGIAAADWAAAHLPARSRLLTDRTDATLLGAYGGMNPIFGRYADISLPHILFGRRFDHADQRAIHGQSLSFVVLDFRLSRELPLIGYYVESDEPGAFQRRQPVSRAALGKLGSVPGVSKVYTNGPIVVYDTSALLR